MHFNKTISISPFSLSGREQLYVLEGRGGYLEEVRWGGKQQMRRLLWLITRTPCLASTPFLAVSWTRLRHLGRSSIPAPRPQRLWQWQQGDGLPLTEQGSAGARWGCQRDLSPPACGSRQHRFPQTTFYHTSRIVSDPTVHQFFTTPA